MDKYIKLDTAIRIVKQWSGVSELIIKHMKENAISVYPSNPTPPRKNPDEEDWDWAVFH